MMQTMMDGNGDGPSMFWRAPTLLKSIVCLTDAELMTGARERPRALGPYRELRAIYF